MGATVDLHEEFLNGGLPILRLRHPLDVILCTLIFTYVIDLKKVDIITNLYDTDPRGLVLLRDPSSKDGSNILEKLGEVGPWTGEDPIVQPKVCPILGHPLPLHHLRMANDEVPGLVRPKHKIQLTGHDLYLYLQKEDVRFRSMINIQMTDKQHS